MSFFENLLRNAASKIESELDPNKWFDKLTDELDSQIGKISSDDLRDGSKAALDALKPHKDDIIAMGRESLMLFVTHVASGDEKKAVLEYIRNSATVDELIDGMLADAAAIVKAKNDENALKAKALEIIKDIGEAGARYLLPLLLTV